MAEAPSTPPQPQNSVPDPSTHDTAPASAPGTATDPQDPPPQNTAGLGDSKSTPSNPAVTRTGHGHKEGGNSGRADRHMWEHWTQISVQQFEEREGPPGDEVPSATVAKSQKTLQEAFYGSKGKKRKRGKFKPTKESDMHAPLCKVANDLLDSTLYSMKDVAGHIEDSKFDHKTDFAMYYDPKNPDGTPQGYPGRSAWKLSQGDIDKSTVADERKPYLARTAWAWAICAIELKVETKSDPFKDQALPKVIPEGGVRPTLRWTQDAARARNQLIRYAMEMFVRQPREFVYTVLIVRNKARLMRWDRCGAVVTEAFDYVQNPKPLLNFLYRLAKGSPRAQGFDTSVSLATRAQIDELNDYRKQLEHSTAPGAAYEMKFIDEMKEDYKLYPLRQLKVPVFALDPKSQPQTSPPPEPLTLVIGKRRIGIFSPTGRGTVGFFAYVVGQRQLVFLKDTWRGDSPGITEELETYRKLHALGVKNIPHIYTRNQIYLATPGRKIIRRKHYRVVTTTLGLPLSEYHDSRAMVHVIRDALEAHRGAWANGQGVLHRDISIGNILIDIRSPDIVRSPRGILTDWDLSRAVDVTPGREPTQHSRSGTWPFMSGPLLMYPIKPHWVSDDLESFIHVMDFLTLQYHNHTLTEEPKKAPAEPFDDDDSLSSHVLLFFYDERSKKVEERRYAVGGKGKFIIYQSDQEPYRLIEPSMFSQLLKALHALCRKHYNSTAVRELPDKYSAFATTFSTEPLEPSDFLDWLDDKPKERPKAPFAPDPLNDHKDICKFLDVALASTRWTSDDKFKDEFAELQFVGPVRNRGLSTFERASETVSQPPADPNTPKKTRGSKRVRLADNAAAVEGGDSDYGGRDDDRDDEYDEDEDEVSEDDGSEYEVSGEEFNEDDV